MWCYFIEKVTGMSVFTPTILALNYPHASAIRIQLLSVPPSVCVSVWSPFHIHPLIFIIICVSHPYK
jgi:hypothetical protein